MEQEFILQALGASVFLVFLLWFLNPFSPAYDMRANPMNFALLFSCSIMSLVMLQFGEKEFKTRISFESLSLFVGVIVLSAVLAYSVTEYGVPIFMTPYPLLPSIFFLLPILQLFVRERL
jgi:uncharacterized membrane protein YadS